jgi:hypothetical protein
VRTPVALMTRTAILAAMRDDGFELPPSANSRNVASAIQQAARAGCLLWDAERIVSTLGEHPVDLRRVRPPRG